MIQVAARKRWLAMVLALITPGLGQVYCCELLRGCCVFIFFIFSPLLLASLAVRLPDSFLLAGMMFAVGTALATYIYGVVDAAKLANSKGTHCKLQQYNGPLVYLAIWMVGTALIFSSDQYLKTTTIEAYKIVSNSMAPTVLRGDYVLTKKPAFRNRAIQKGDIVIAVYPDDRSKMLIRQIEALPGETLLDKDGSPLVVPHGKVIVRGTGRNAIDSTLFGPLDMRDIVGRVVQIYFSRNGSKIRWERFGKLVNQ